jgi:hypothetical protein
MPTYIQTTKNQGVFTTTGSVTILNGASLSSAINLENRILVGIIMPNAWTAAALTFQFSIDGVNYHDAYSLTAALTATPAIANSFINIAKTATFDSARFLKIRSGTTASPVNQLADRTLTIVSILP